MRTFPVCLSILLLSAPASVFAGSPGEGNWIGGETVEIRNDYVKFGDELYTFDSEEITNAYGLQSNGEPLCKAETHIASRTKSGEIVLVKTMRIKHSYSKGMFCKYSVSLKKYSEPYMFTQVVLSGGKDGKLDVRKLEVYDGLDRPELKVPELQDPDLINNAGLKKYLAKEKPDPKVNGFRFGGITEKVLTPTENGPKEELSAGDRLGDEVYSATGDKGLLTHEAQEAEESAELK
ncbi:MAG: hypothetical protein ACXVBE_08275 [Bdellovibrionota bacterium]